VIAPARAVVDASVLIAAESGRAVDETGFPEDPVVSVVTLAELQAGVLAASGSETRARRMATLDRLSTVEVLDVTEDTAWEWAQLRIHLVEKRRRVNVNDLWIAASAVVHRLPIVTQGDDFDPLDGVRGLVVVRV
jgi:predicted nucleic acid-binding protein